MGFYRVFLCVFLWFLYVFLWFLGLKHDFNDFKGCLSVRVFWPTALWHANPCGLAVLFFFEMKILIFHPSPHDFHWFFTFSAQATLPRCPFPHPSGKTNPMTADEWMQAVKDVGRDYPKGWFLVYITQIFLFKKKKKTLESRVGDRWRWCLICSFPSPKIPAAWAFQINNST